MIFVNGRIDRELSNPLLRNVILDPEILHIAKTMVETLRIHHGRAVI
jgi:hypothetical protein